MSEASCPNFEPRAHARLTGLTNCPGTYERFGPPEQMALLRAILTMLHARIASRRVYHARMARRAHEHLRCSLCERSERGDNKLDNRRVRAVYKSDTRLLCAVLYL